MERARFAIDGIPAIVWGPESEKAYIFVHGKLSNKEEAEGLARAVVAKGWQALSFDLPEHGERRGEDYACNAWNGVRDLGIIGDYAKNRWGRLSLFACSFGAYLSLLAYPGLDLEKARFLSPILDMERLIQNMMMWFGVDEATLQSRREIPTPMGEPLSWEYYQWVRAHRIEQWSVPTSIFYGTKDNLTEREVVDGFSRRFGCELTVLEGAEHFMQDPAQLAAIEAWLAERA